MDVNDYNETSLIIENKIDQVASTVESLDRELTSLQKEYGSRFFFRYIQTKLSLLDTELELVSSGTHMNIIISTFYRQLYIRRNASQVYQKAL